LNIINDINLSEEASNFLECYDNQVLISIYYLKLKRKNCVIIYYREIACTHRVGDQQATHIIVL